jgi:hypothetical protein
MIQKGFFQRPEPDSRFFNDQRVVEPYIKACIPRPVAFLQPGMPNIRYRRSPKPDNPFQIRSYMKNLWNIGILLVKGCKKTGYVQELG